jgi:protocatechuate 3,4-dioxygenase beta subunit
MSLIYPKESLDAFPAHLTPGYRSTVKRSPSKPLIVLPHTLTELTGPVYGHDTIQEGDNDLTQQHKGEPLGERIVVHGLMERDGKLGLATMCVGAGQGVSLAVERVN